MHKPIKKLYKPNLPSRMYYIWIFLKIARTLLKSGNK